MKVAKKPDLNPHIRTWIRRQKNKINLGAEVLKQAPRAYSVIQSGRPLWHMVITRPLEQS